jgi:glycosyltransferase involved in cell wall biosynthesis
MLNYVPSRYSYDQLEQHGIRNKMIWGRGIDTTRFTPQKRRSGLRQTIAPGGEKIMLYVGRLSKEKKVDVLIEATQLLKDGGQAVKLVLVGDGPHRQELQSLNVPEVHFAGYQSGEALQAYFASADLFVFASENETYGNVILEAMASGLPVVSVNSGGVRENLVDGFNGIAIEANKPAEFTRKISTLLSDEAAVEKLGRNAWQHAQNKDWENLFQLLYDSYHRI